MQDEAGQEYFGNNVQRDYITAIRLYPLLKNIEAGAQPGLVWTGQYYVLVHEEKNG